MLARSAIRAERRFFKVPRGGEGHCLQKSSASGAKIRQLSGRFSPWSDDQILSAVSSGHSIGANAQRPTFSGLRSLEPDNSDTFVSSPRLDLRFDVLVQREEVLRVVLVFNGHEPAVVRAVGGFDRVFSLLT